MSVHPLRSPSSALDTGTLAERVERLRAEAHARAGEHADLTTKVLSLRAIRERTH
jgi:hypothetical protein